jgi:heme/copper-type cytochrome/quinol oxidase subunit 1
MYLIFAICAGIIGGALSVGIRMELQEPGIQIFTGLQIFDGDAAIRRHVDSTPSPPRMA